jgi:hypothetical protein
MGIEEEEEEDKVIDCLYQVTESGERAIQRSVQVS